MMAKTQKRFSLQIACSVVSDCSSFWVAFLFDKHKKVMRCHYDPIRNAHRVECSNLPLGIRWADPDDVFILLGELIFEVLFHGSLKDVWISHVLEFTNEFCGVSTRPWRGSLLLSGLNSLLVGFEKVFETFIARH